MYETNEYKIITSPGKFENEMYYIPELWELCLISGEDLILYDDNYSEEIPISLFRIDQELLGKYPELREYNNPLFIALWENEQGFVYSEVITNDDLAQVGEDFRQELLDNL